MCEAHERIQAVQAGQLVGRHVQRCQRLRDALPAELRRRLNRAEAVGVKAEVGERRAAGEVGDGGEGGQVAVVEVEVRDGVRRVEQLVWIWKGRGRVVRSWLMHGAAGHIGPGGGVDACQSHTRSQRPAPLPQAVGRGAALMRMTRRPACVDARDGSQQRWAGPRTRKCNGPKSKFKSAAAQLRLLELVRASVPVPVFLQRRQECVQCGV